MKNLALPATIDQDCFPLRITFEEPVSTREFAHWYADNQADVTAFLHQKGAVLFEGLPLGSVEQFGPVAGAMAEEFTDYIDISYQRRKLSANVYVSTEYDAAFPIKLHNELSYANRWPSRLIFGCILPAAAGGETPLADSRRVLQSLDPDLLAELRARKIRYVRNLHGGQGFGYSWQETFRTTDRDAVETYCRREQMACHWKEDGGLKLVAVRPPVRRHPVTGEEVWFSVAELYHPSHFSKEYYETLIILAQGNEEELPLYSSFGDGTRIPDAAIREIIRTIESQVTLRTWNQGDLLLLDNMLVSHGRMPYKGERQVVVYLGK
ncbi:MAG: TauD/TfdA family dioxygenase [Cytophagales bacterium]|nr:TauD/TfdA family dioxygenase [Cytophagales bacterium]